MNQTKLKTCDVHGDFEATGFELLNSVVYSSCPTCSAMKAQADADADAAKNRQHELSILNKIGISKRNQLKNFDCFVADTDETANQLASCRIFAKQVAKGYGGNLLMIGKVGTGKTLLASMIIQSLEFKSKCRIIKFTEIMRLIRATYKNKSAKTDLDVINEFSEVKLLVIDEMGAQIGSDSEKQAIFEIIDNRYQAMLPTVIISNLGMGGLTEVMGSRVIDRLREDGGKLITFNSDSKRGTNE